MLDTLHDWVHVPAVQDTPLLLPASKKHTPEVQAVSALQASPSSTGAGVLVGRSDDEQPTTEEISP